jgi:hypothetical protein
METARHAREQSNERPTHAPSRCRYRGRRQYSGMHLSGGVELRGPNVTRQRPPNRRGHELLGFEHDGIRYTAGIGHFVDGRGAKIFRNIAKHGTALDVNARAAAVAASPLVRYRCPVDTLRRVNRNSDGSGSGPLTCALDPLVE